MRQISFFLILTVSFLWTACNNEILDNGADFKFATADREANKINLNVTIRYRLKSRLENKLIRKYGRHYKDSLMLPAISSISRKVLEPYSAGEIYNYKRDEIEQKLGEKTKTAFVEYDIELTDFFLNTVEFPDTTLLRKLGKEYVIRFQKAINDCSREIKGVVTKIYEMKDADDLVFYEFTIENKKYERVLSPKEIGGKVILGDSLVIEYACEDPNFHKVKK